jgi:hypothetical protein
VGRKKQNEVTIGAHGQEPPQRLLNHLGLPLGSGIHPSTYTPTDSRELMRLSHVGRAGLLPPPASIRPELADFCGTMVSGSYVASAPRDPIADVEFALAESLTGLPIVSAVCSRLPDSLVVG